jgi:hypothetical protein
MRQLLANRLPFGNGDGNGTVAAAGEIEALGEIFCLEAFLASNMPAAALELLPPAVADADADPDDDDTDPDDDDDTDPDDDDDDPDGGGAHTVVDDDNESGSADAEPAMTIVPWVSAALDACVCCKKPVVSRRELWPCPVCCIRSCCAACAPAVHCGVCCQRIADALNRVLKRVRFSYAQQLI